MQDKVRTILVETLKDIIEDPKVDPTSKDIVLFGSEGCLDSLGLVNYVVGVEERIQEEFGKTIALADDRAMSAKRSPFRTVGTMVDYTCSLLAEQA